MIAEDSFPIMSSLASTISLPLEVRRIVTMALSSPFTDPSSSVGPVEGSRLTPTDDLCRALGLASAVSRLPQHFQPHGSRPKGSPTKATASLCAIGSPSGSNGLASAFPLPPEHFKCHGSESRPAATMAW